MPTSSNDCGLATAKRPDTDPSNPSLRSYLGTETKSRHAGRSRKLVGVIATRNLARVGALLSRSQLVWSRAGEYFGTPAILAETIPAARATKAFAEMKQNWPTFWPTALSRGPKLKNGCCSKPRRKPFLARAAPEGEENSFAQRSADGTGCRSAKVVLPIPDSSSWIDELRRKTDSP